MKEVTPGERCEEEAGKGGRELKGAADGVEESDEGKEEDGETLCG